MEERQAFLQGQLCSVDDASTIVTSSTRSTSTAGRADRSAVSYDSLTYSSTTSDDDTSRYFQYQQNHSSNTGSCGSASQISYGTSTVLNSKQLIQNLRRQQQTDLQSQQQQQQHLQHPGLQPLSSEGYPSACFHRHHADTQSNFNGSSNVYRPRWTGSNDYSSYPQELLLLPPSHSRSMLSCLTSPRVLFTVAICGIIFCNLILGNSHLIEQWWEMGCHGMSAQRTAHLAQANLVSMATLKALKLPPATVSDDSIAKPHVKVSKAVASSAITAPSNVKNDISNKSDSTNENDGCEATIMLIRHCEKGGLKSHCSFMGFERSVYLATLFGDDKQWPAPSQIYALNKDRTHKLNYREVETVQAISDTVGVPVNRDYSTLDTKALSHHLLDQLLDGDLCGKLVLVSWKHSDIPKLAQHLGCGPIQGCPWDYKGKDFDSTWQIRYVAWKKDSVAGFVFHCYLPDIVPLVLLVDMSLPTFTT
jgi:hypothetical protein